MPVGKMSDKPHGKSREKPWYFRNRSGKRSSWCIKYFKTKKEADREEERYNSQKVRMELLGWSTTKKDLEKYTARDIVRSYASGNIITEDKYEDKDKEQLEELKKESFEDSGLPDNDFYVLWRFSNLPICDLKLSQFNKNVAKQYVKDRLKQTYTPYNGKTVKTYRPNTINREIIKIGNAWKWAADTIPELTDLTNPWNKVPVEGAGGGQRNRGLKKGELDRLIHHCKGCLGSNRYYVPLAIYLAINTGMRREEIELLTWDDIDFENRRIEIRKSKTGPRKIVLTPITGLSLGSLMGALANGGCINNLDGTLFKPTTPIDNRNRIFRDTDGNPMSGNALSDAFDKVVERAGIKDLHFHDLRSAAQMMFHRANLSEKEQDIMKNGLKKKDPYGVLDIYLEIIQDKLDKFLWGKTQEEAFMEVRQERLALILEGMEAGLTKEEAIKKVIEDERAHLRDVLDTINTNPPS